ncbi:MAG: EamA family transporter [Chthoniobacterales bacterium]
MTALSLVLILTSLVTFVAGNLILKRAMEHAAALGLSQSTTIRYLIAGTAVMAVSFFLNLGLLRQFDLSYLYPFQGLSVIIISLCAAVLLREKLTLPLMIGSLLITAGVVLVSIS